MAWLAVDKNGNETIFSSKPTRDGDIWGPTYNDDQCVDLPKGTIKKIIGYDLNWKDKPVKILTKDMKLTEELKQRIDAFIESKSSEELEAILDKYELNSKDSNKKEFKIGEVFKCGISNLRCEEDKGVCEGCIFNNDNLLCEELIFLTGPCSSEKREDNKNVVFVKVDN